MKLTSEFVRLPLRFDPSTMAAEIARFAPGDWIAHPDGDAGNAAIPLISAGGAINNHCHGAMQPTRHLQRCAYLQQVIASFGEVFGRSRLMRLDAGSEVVAHVDYHHHWHTHVRIHIPILTSPAVEFHCGERVVNMGAGESWIFDSWRLHRVVNGGTEPRVHLVIDTTGSSGFWDMVAGAHAAQAAGEALPERYVPFTPGAEARIATERFNMLPIMPPGEVEGLVEGIIAEIDMAPAGESTQHARMIGLMRNFCRDWRVLWHCFGPRAEGLPHYEALLKSSAASLPSHESDVLLGSNRCHVRDVFLNKVIAAALAPELMADFREAPASDAAGGVESTGRNARCPCGSGRRFKHCHGMSQEQPATP